MRTLTIDDLDAQLAEQLPARELMGGNCSRSCNGGGEGHGGGESNSASSGNNTAGLINVANGNNVQILTFGSQNGNYSSAD